MKTKYKGVTTEISTDLLEPNKRYKDDPRKSYKFDTLSLYYDGKYYFPEDIKPNETTNPNNDKPYQIQAVYYSYKWFQDTFYISEDFKNFLLSFVS